MSETSFIFSVQLSRSASEGRARVEIPNASFDEVTGRDIRIAICERWGINYEDTTIQYYGLWWDYLGDDDLICMEDHCNPNATSIMLKFAQGVTPPFTTFPDDKVVSKEEGDYDTKSPKSPVLDDRCLPLLPPGEHSVVLGVAGKRTTIGSVVDVLLPTIYSEVVTSVRGRVVVSDKTTTTSHVVYPFVFRAGGKDMQAMWATELRERLAASVHPVTLGRDTYRSALQLLDDSPSPSPSGVMWELTVSISFRPATLKSSANIEV